MILVASTAIIASLPVTCARGQHRQAAFDVLEGIQNQMASRQGMKERFISPPAVPAQLPSRANATFVLRERSSTIDLLSHSAPIVTHHVAYAWPRRLSVSPPVNAGICRRTF